jgi:hypothetical protein
MRTEGRTDRHDGANSRYPQFCERTSTALRDVHTKDIRKLNKTYILA